MNCKKHPKYEVKRKPRADCVTCWVMWLTKENNRLSKELNKVKNQISEERHHYDPIYGDYWNDC